jgi:alcohol dehydrogenase/propanol-preferring alcohol dehydrogenase
VAGAIVVDIDARAGSGGKTGALATVDGGAADALEQLASKAAGPIRAVSISSVTPRPRNSASTA